jgi:hypothetical protein
MNNLLQLYDITSEFAERHRMISEFGVLGSEEEIGSVEFEYRSMQLVVSSSNISRELNRPTFRLNFSLIVMDKTVAGDARARLLSTEENIFVIGQYQDYLLQQDNDVEFEDVEVVSIDDADDYVITVAYCDFGVNFSRKGYTNAIAEPVPPVVNDVPTISGTIAIGETITATAADKDGIPIPATTWQWQYSADGETEWTNIEGETEDTYVILEADGNNFLRVVQTETNSEGVDFEASAATEQVPAAPVIDGVPTITGTVEVGEELTAAAAEVTGTPTPDTTWQWQISDDGETEWADIEEQTSATYTIVSGDDSKYLRVVQTETNTEGTDSLESAATTAVVTP